MSEEEDHKVIWEMLTTIDSYVMYLSTLQRQWWQQFYTRHTQHDFEITEANNDKVCLTLTNLRYEYRTSDPPNPPGLSIDDCRHTLNIFCSLRPDITQTVALGLRRLARMRACLDNI
jgi:ribosomal protein L30/L7E